MKDLKQKAIRGGFAKICSQGANLTVRVGWLAIMARLLEPADFGLVAMVVTFTGFLNLFRDFGLSTAAVQRTDISEEQMSTLFWINVLIGCALAMLAVAGAPLISAVYHEPRVVWIAVALAMGFLFSAAGIQHSALLQRRMRFITLAAIDTGSLMVSVIVGIAMALSGLGYWALVGMSLTLPLISALAAWLATGWIPGTPRRDVGIRSMVRFGGMVTLNGIVAYIATNVDKVLLGRVWGADALGIYGRAFQLINIPTDNLNSAVGDVALSALSRIKEDTLRLKSYFLQGYLLLVSITLPITVACALLAPEIVQVVLGPKWTETVPIVRILAPTILLFGMINPMWWLLVSLGMVARSLKIGLIQAPLLVAGYFVGLPYGPQGVALGYSVVLVLWTIPNIAWCVHGTAISLKDIIRVVARPIASAILAGILAWGAVFLWPQALSSIQRLALGVVVLFGAYVAILFYVMGQKALYLGVIRDLIRRPTQGELPGIGIT